MFAPRMIGINPWGPAGLHRTSFHAVIDLHRPRPPLLPSSSHLGPEKPRGAGRRAGSLPRPDLWGGGPVECRA